MVVSESGMVFLQQKYKRDKYCLFNYSLLKRNKMIASNYFKKIIGIAVFVLFLFPLYSNAMQSTAEGPTIVALPSDSLKDAKIAAHIVQRVNEIQAMDLSALSPAEKKALRKELMQMKRDSDGLDSKIYISIGAAIIIVLLLILILR